MTAKRLCLGFTADQLGREDFTPAPRGMVLSELSDWLSDLEEVILNGSMRKDLGRDQLHQIQFTTLQQVLRKAGFELTIECKNPFRENNHSTWITNAELVVSRLS